MLRIDYDRHRSLHFSRVVFSTHIYYYYFFYYSYKWNTGLVAISRDSIDSSNRFGFYEALISLVISVAFYSEREKSDKFCSEALISA